MTVLMRACLVMKVCLLYLVKLSGTYNSIIYVNCLQNLKMTNTGNMLKILILGIIRILPKVCYFCSRYCFLFAVFALM